MTFPIGLSKPNQLTFQKEESSVSASILEEKLTVKKKQVLKDLPRDEVLAFLHRENFLNEEDEFIDPQYGRVKTLLPNEDSKNSIDQLLQSKINYPIHIEIHGKKYRYAIKRKLEDLLYQIQEFAKAHGMEIKSLSICGSESYKEAGAPFCLNEIAQLTSNLRPLLQKLETKVLQDVQDVDIHIQYVENSTSNMNGGLEDALVVDLIREHYRILKFQVNFSDCDQEVLGLESLFQLVKDSDQKKKISSIKILGKEIPWLFHYVLRDVDLQNFLNAILSKQKTSKWEFEAFLDELACKFIFRMDMEKIKGGMSSKGSAFKEYYSVLIPHLKSWFRITCCNEDEREYDFLFIKINNVPNIKFHEFKTELLNGISFKCSKQAILDKFCNLIRWEKFEGINQHQWAYHWYFVTKGLTCPQKESDRLLNESFAKHCLRKKNPLLTVLNGLQSRLQKRNTHTPTFIGCFFLNVCSKLPQELFDEEAIRKIWETVPLFLICTKEVLSQKAFQPILEALLKYDPTHQILPHLQALLENGIPLHPDLKAYPTYNFPVFNGSHLWSLIHLNFAKTLDPALCSLFNAILFKRIPPTIAWVFLKEVFHRHLMSCSEMKQKSFFSTALTTHNGLLSIQVKIENSFLIVPFDPVQILEEMRKHYFNLENELEELLKLWDHGEYLSIEPPQNIPIPLEEWVSQSIQCIQTGKLLLVKLGYIHLLGCRSCKSAKNAIQLYFPFVMSFKQPLETKKRFIEQVKPFFCELENVLERFGTESPPNLDLMQDWILSLARSKEKNLPDLAAAIWFNYSRYLQTDLQKSITCQLVQILTNKNIKIALSLIQDLDLKGIGSAELWKPYLLNLFRTTSKLTSAERISHFYFLIDLTLRHQLDQIPLDHALALLEEQKDEEAFEFISMASSKLSNIPSYLVQGAQTFLNLMKGGTDSQEKAFKLMREIDRVQPGQPYASIIFERLAKKLAEMQTQAHQRLESFYRDILKEISDDHLAAEKLKNWSQSGFFRSSSTSANLWLERCQKRLKENVGDAVRLWEIGQNRGVLETIDYELQFSFVENFLKILISQKEYSNFVEEVTNRIKKETTKKLSPEILVSQKARNQKKEFHTLIDIYTPQKGKGTLEKLLNIVDLQDQEQVQKLNGFIPHVLNSQNGDQVYQILKIKKLKEFLKEKYLHFCHQALSKALAKKDSTLAGLTSMTLNAAKESQLPLVVDVAVTLSKIKSKEIQASLEWIYHHLGLGQKWVEVVRLFLAVDTSTDKLSQKQAEIILNALNKTLNNKNSGIKAKEIIPLLLLRLDCAHEWHSPTISLCRELITTLLSKKHFSEGEELFNTFIAPKIKDVSQLSEDQTIYLLQVARNFIPENLNLAIQVFDTVFQKYSPTTNLKPLLDCYCLFPDSQFKGEPLRYGQLLVKLIQKIPQEIDRNDTRLNSKVKKILEALSQDEASLEVGLDLLNYFPKHLDGWHSLIELSLKTKSLKLIKKVREGVLKQSCDLKIAEQNYKECAKWLNFEMSVNKILFLTDPPEEILERILKICDKENPLNKLHPTKQIIFIRFLGLINPFYEYLGNENRLNGHDLIIEMLLNVRKDLENLLPTNEEPNFVKIDLLLSLITTWANDPASFLNGCQLLTSLIRRNLTQDLLDAVPTFLYRYILFIDSAILESSTSFLDLIVAIQQNLCKPLEPGELILPLCHLKHPQFFEAAVAFGFYRLEEKLEISKSSSPIIKDGYLALLDRMKNEKHDKFHLLLKHLGIHKIISPQEIREFNKSLSLKSITVEQLFHNELFIKCAEEFSNLIEDFKNNFFIKKENGITDIISDRLCTEIDTFNRTELIEHVSPKLFFHYPSTLLIRFLLYDFNCKSTRSVNAILSKLSSFKKHVEVQFTHYTLSDDHQLDLRSTLKFIKQCLLIHNLPPKLNIILIGYLFHRIMVVIKSDLHPQHFGEIKTIIRMFCLQKAGHNKQTISFHSFLCASLIKTSEKTGIYINDFEELVFLKIDQRTLGNGLHLIPQDKRVELVEKVLKTLFDLDSPWTTLHLTGILDDHYELLDSCTPSKVSFWCQKLLDKLKTSPINKDYEGVVQGVSALFKYRSIKGDFSKQNFLDCMQLVLEYLKISPELDTHELMLLLEQSLQFLHIPKTLELPETRTLVKPLIPHFAKWNSNLFSTLLLDAGLDNFKLNLKILQRITDLYFNLYEFPHPEIQNIAYENWVKIHDILIRMTDRPKVFNEGMLEMAIIFIGDGIKIGLYKNKYVQYLERLELLINLVVKYLKSISQPQIVLILLLYLYTKESKIFGPKDEKERYLRVTQLVKTIEKLHHLNVPFADVAVHIFLAQGPMYNRIFTNFKKDHIQASSFLRKIESRKFKEFMTYNSFSIRTCFFINEFINFLGNIENP